MKKVFLFLFFFAALASVAVGQNANDWFITRYGNLTGLLLILMLPATDIL